MNKKAKVAAKKHSKSKARVKAKAKAGREAVKSGRAKKSAK